MSTQAVSWGRATLIAKKVRVQAASAYGSARLLDRFDRSSSRRTSHDRRRLGGRSTRDTDLEGRSALILTYWAACDGPR